MKTIELLSAGVAVAFAALLPAPSAHAIPRTFVSGTGTGSACSQAAPCATFQLAHAATDAGGEVNCVDAGNFGAVTITKSITIDCAGTLASITSAGNGVTIDTDGVVVRLRNLTLDGVGSAGVGIRFTHGAALFVENCTITNYTGNQVADGIDFFPPTGTAKLFVSASVISNNRLTGILILPSGTASARAIIDGVRAEKNGIAIDAFGKSGTGLIAVQIRNSVFTGNLEGIQAVTSAGHSTTSVTVDRSSSILNFDGIVAEGPSAFVLLGRSTVISNGSSGLFADQGGTIFSYQNNHLTGNVTDGAPTGTLTLK